MYLSIVPASTIPNIAALSFIIDKFIHFLIFMYLALIGLMCGFQLSNSKLLIYIFSFGLLIEIIHYYHPYRYFEIADLLANLIGIFLALALYSLKKDDSKH
jgi:VanZ family protein